MWLWSLHFSEFFLIYEVPFKQKFHSACLKYKIYFYLQILFYICFQKPRYYCILMNYCSSFPANVWEIHFLFHRNWLKPTEHGINQSSVSQEREKTNAQKYGPWSNNLGRCCIKCNYIGLSPAELFGAIIFQTSFLLLLLEKRDIHLVKISKCSKSLYNESKSFSHHRSSDLPLLSLKYLFRFSLFIFIYVLICICILFSFV